ncbi:mastermind-like protein 3 [Ptychodera flava]|uniref:mastermind-like protein 3 n=1 Tax=Ptychodera flava TaxID=63121 RepID=UPI00396A748D
MGDYVSPKRRAIVDRLRKRIELCRRHHNICQARYERTQASRFDQEAHETFLLHQRVLESRAKKQSKGLKQESGQHKGSARCDNSNSTGTGNEANNHLRNQLLTQKIKRKLETGGSPNAKLSNGDSTSVVNGHDNTPSPKRHCTQPPPHGMDVSVSIVQQTSGNERIQTNVDVTIQTQHNGQAPADQPHVNMKSTERNTTQSGVLSHGELAAGELDKPVCKQEPANFNNPCAEQGACPDDLKDIPNIDHFLNLNGSPMNDNMIQQILEDLMNNDPESLAKLEEDLKQEEAGIVEKLREMDEQVNLGLKQEPISESKPSIPCSGGAPTPVTCTSAGTSSYTPNVTPTHSTMDGSNMQDTNPSLTHSEQLKQMATQKYLQRHQNPRQHSMNFPYGSPMPTSNVVKSETYSSAMPQPSMQSSQQLTQHQELKRMQQLHQLQQAKLHNHKSAAMVPTANDQHLNFANTKPLSHMPDHLDNGTAQNNLTVSQTTMAASQNNMAALQPMGPGNRDMQQGSFKQEPDAALCYPGQNFSNSQHQMVQQNRLQQLREHQIHQQQRTQFMALPPHSTEQQQPQHRLTMDESLRRQKQEYIRQHLIIKQQHEQKLREQQRQIHVLEQQKQQQQQQQQLRDERLRQEQIQRYLNRPPPEYTRPASQPQTTQAAVQQPPQPQQQPQQPSFQASRQNSIPQVLAPNMRQGASSHHYPLNNTPSTSQPAYSQGNRHHLGHTVQHPASNIQVQTSTAAAHHGNPSTPAGPSNNMASYLGMNSRNPPQPHQQQQQQQQPLQQQQQLPTQQTLMRQNPALGRGQTAQLVGGQNPALVTGQNQTMVSGQTSMGRGQSALNQFPGYYNGDHQLQRERGLSAALALSSRNTQNTSIYAKQAAAAAAAQPLNPSGPGWNRDGLQRQASQFNTNQQRQSSQHNNIAMPTTSNFGNSRISNPGFHSQTLKKETSMSASVCGQQSQLNYALQRQLNQRSGSNRPTMPAVSQHRLPNVPSNTAHGTFNNASAAMQPDFPLDPDILDNATLGPSDADILDTLNNSDWDEILNKLPV